MIRKQHGFSLVELIITLMVFILAIAGATRIFIPLVAKFKQQSRVMETNVQSLVGLELLKTDLEQAGFGLPWFFPNDTINYTETAATPAGSTIGGVSVNDAPSNAPRAVAAFNNVAFGGAVNGNGNITGIVTGSDYLVIKSVAVSGADNAQKWTYLFSDPTNTTNAPKVWNLASENPSVNDQVIVIRPYVSDLRLRELVMNNAQFSTPYALSMPAAFFPGAPPQDAYQTAFLVYDVDPAVVTMPFNRADYFVGIPAAMPSRCASGTGVLYKAVLNQDGTYHAQTTTPLLDCVADMQVVFGLDMNNDNIIGTYSAADGSATSDGIAQQEGKAPADVQPVLLSHLDLSDYRSRVIEVRVYILAHEGQMDWNYTYTNPNTTSPTCNGPNSSLVGEDSIGGANVGRCFTLSALPDPNWQHYRWKVYMITVKLQNMRY